MADKKVNAEGMSGISNQNPAPFTDDYEITKGMKVPETITVASAKNMQNFGENRAPFHGKQMTVPERIVLEGSDSGTRASRSIALENVGVNFDNYMGGMVTPPRTLTVDDTSSRYMGRSVEESESRAEFDRLSHNLNENTKNPEDQSDFRLQSEIVRLNKRVEWLEKKIAEKQSNGFWKTTIFCILTVVNPIIIHWLFSSRR